VEGQVRVLDEVGRDDSLRPGVERSSVEQEPERKIRSAVSIGGATFMIFGAGFDGEIVGGFLADYWKERAP